MENGDLCFMNYIIDTEKSNERRNTNKKVAIIIFSIFMGVTFISYFWNYFDLYRFRGV